MRVAFSETKYNAKNYSDKVLMSVWNVVGEDEAGNLRNVATLKYYQPKTTRSIPHVFANLHVHSGLITTNGSAHVKGLGEHLTSKCLGKLAESAGIGIWDEDDKDCWDFGYGDSEIESFMRAIAVACGYINFIVIRNGK